MLASWCSSSVVQVVVAVTFLKLLLVPFYRSTDFEVHRNWLAITHSLPLDRWYVDETSQWTLDYPPLFAWFEFGLSQVARHFDSEMLIVKNLEYASHATVLFQRLSVILSDLILAVGVSECHKGIVTLRGRGSNEELTNMMVLIFANAGLLLVDHVHFQYNGFLSGVALMSLGYVLQRKMIWGGILFATLLNLKHIYLYCAPAYFVYLLRHYCFHRGLSFHFEGLKRLTGLGVTVALVFAASLGPFIYLRQLPVLAKRLFPFKRGLSHAYWAPNFWALYNGLDRVLALTFKKFGLIEASSQSSDMTGGLVQEFEHSVLPSVAPSATFVLAFLSMVPALFKLWSTDGKSPEQFIRAIVLCSFGSYLFGWHVHEKAILLVILPLTVSAFLSPQDFSQLFVCSTTGNVSLLPLLFRPQEGLVRVLVVALYALYLYRSLLQNKRTFVTKSQLIYVWGLALVVLFDSLAKLILGPRLPFLPLMIYSVYCALGLFNCWIRLYATFLSHSDDAARNKKIG